MRSRQLLYTEERQPAKQQSGFAGSSTLAPRLQTKQKIVTAAKAYQPVAEHHSTDETDLFDAQFEVHQDGLVPKHVVHLPNF